jgi:hypothetical protein
MAKAKSLLEMFQRGIISKEEFVKLTRRKR